MEEFKPGQVISPQGDGAGNDAQPVAPPTPTPAPPQPMAQVAQNEPAASTEQAAPEPNWQFRQEAETPAANQPQYSTSLDDEISWEAAEFVAHDKSIRWYVTLGLVGVVSAALVYVVTKDKITTGIIAFAALAFGLFAARKPREQTYVVNRTGVHIGSRTYELVEYKSFSIAEEGERANIVFMPLKRFMPALTIYLTPEVEDSVVDFLAQALPLEQHRQDAIDSLMKRIHF